MKREAWGMLLCMRYFCENVLTQPGHVKEYTVEDEIKMLMVIVIDMGL